MFRENPQGTAFLLQPGRYDFYRENALHRELFLSNSDDVPERNLALLLEGMENAVLDGGGAEFVFHGPMMPVTLLDCKDVTVKNLAIDWEIPLSAEGEVREAAGNEIQVFIDPKKYPCRAENGALIFTGENWEEPLRHAVEFDVSTGKVRYDTGDCFPKVEAAELGEGLFRLKGDFSRLPQPGNVLVLRHSPRVHAGIFADSCREVSFEHLNIHSTGGLGVLCQFCEDLNFLDVNLVPDRKNGRRFLSGHDDGLHLSNNRGVITVEGCCFEGLMDDPLNVHGTSVRIAEVMDSHTLRGEFVHPQSLGFSRWALTGQEVSFLNRRSLKSLGTAIVKSFSLLSKGEFVIAFDGKIPEEIGAGDALENLTNTPSLICRRNLFGSGRARGILVSTPKPVLIEQNLFESSGCAILLAGDANQWYESGSCRDVVIRDNVFRDCCLTSDYQFCDGVISICPEVPEPDADAPFHSGIRIAGNVFHLYDAPLLYAKSTAGLLFSGNRLFRSHAYEPRYPHEALFTFDCCSDVNVGKNWVTGKLVSDEISIARMEEKEISCEDYEISVEQL